MYSSISIIDEVRFGLQYHDVYHGFIPTDPTMFRFDQLEDISLEVLFASPDIDAFRWIGSPRPNLGVNINFNGQESVAHLALTWQLRPFAGAPLFVEGTFGAAVNNGSLMNAPAGFKNLGCNLQFYEQFGIGADLGDNARVILTYDHTSNADLCNANEGLSSLGLKLGWQF